MLFLWFLYKIQFYKNFYFYNILSYYYYYYYVFNSSLFLFNSVLNNTFRKKLVFFLLKKSYKNRYVWTINKSRFIKIKFNFKYNLFSKKPKKLKNLNKILKLRRSTGLFKKKLNIRTTVLRRRSLLFNLVFKNKKKK